MSCFTYGQVHKMYKHKLHIRQVHIHKLHTRASDSFEQAAEAERLIYGTAAAHCSYNSTLVQCTLHYTLVSAKLSHICCTLYTSVACSSETGINALHKYIYAYMHKCTSIYTSAQVYAQVHKYMHKCTSICKSSHWNCSRILFQLSFTECPRH